MDKLLLDRRLEDYLEGDLAKGIPHSDGYTFQAAHPQSWPQILESEAYWPANQALPEDDLRRDFSGPQILALDETGKARGRVSGIWLLGNTVVDRVPNWEAYWHRERDRVKQALSAGLSPHSLSRCEITGVIVDPKLRRQGIASRMLLYYMRLIAELKHKGQAFESLTWSADNPGYQRWLEQRGLEDHPNIHAEYVSLVEQGLVQDRVHSFYFKWMEEFNPVEKIEGILTENRYALLRILSLEGGCQGEGYKEACHRGIRLDGTGGVNYFYDRLSEASYWLD